MSAASDPSVTVLMPMYNSARYLREAVDSILAQSFAGFELLVMDNASTDDGPAILQGYRDPRIRYVHNGGNIGLAASLNRGIDLARGAFIARMDADDIALPRRLELQVDFLRRHPEVGMCGGQVYKVVDGRRHWMWFPKRHEDIRVTLLFHTAFPHPAVMIRRSVLVEQGLRYREDLRNLEDYELWTRLTEVTRTANLPDFLLDYRVHAQQMSGSQYELVLALRREIHARMVHRLIPEADDDDLHFHGLVSVHHERFSAEQLDRAERWLLRLLEANERRRVYDPAAMRSIFARRWAALCAQRAPLSLRVYARYLASPLRRAAVLGGPALRLLGKCLLHRSPE